MLQSYIQTCLQYAVKTDRSSIAFPTIGTVDCNYPKLDVAQRFVRTIGEFMKKLSSSKLKEISVVIFKTDQESTMVSLMALFELNLAHAQLAFISQQYERA